MRRLLPLMLLVAAGTTAGAQSRDTVRVDYSASRCHSCAAWNQPHAPARIFGNTYYVGTAGLSSILVTSPKGHILIDGTLAMSAPQVMANIRALGFRVEDIKVILNSHAHFDHAGGIAAIQRASEAEVAASPWSAATIERGMSDSADPQFAIDLPYPPVASVRVIADDESIRVGPLTLTAHFTPGHTPGGTSWTWVSCEHDECLHMLYADSQTAVSAPGFLFTKNTTYPTAVHDFENGLTRLASLPCDILMTTHPDASNLIERLAARDSGTIATLRDPASCRDYVARSRAAVMKRFASEGGNP